MYKNIKTDKLISLNRKLIEEENELKIGVKSFGSPDAKTSCDWIKLMRSIKEIGTELQQREVNQRK